MIAELISTGTEVLLGDILNTNVRYLARECAALGFDIYHQTVVGDNPGRFCAAIETAAGRADFVIITGGLGGTGDDITLPVLNALVDGGQAPGDHVYPQEAEQLPNHNGQAAGVWMRHGEAMIIALPGPPREMTVMFEREVRPRLARFSDAIIESLEVKIGMLGEYRTYELLPGALKASTNPSVATYAKAEGVTLRLTAKAADHTAAQKLLEQGLADVRRVFGKRVISADGKPKAATLIDLLRERGETLTVLEGLTGGLLAAALTEIPEACDVLRDARVVCSERELDRLCGDPPPADEKAKVAALLDRLRAETGADLCLVTNLATTPGAGLYLGLQYGEERIIEPPHLNLDRDRNRRILKNYALDRAIIALRDGGQEQGRS